MTIHFTDSVKLLGLSNNPQNLFPNSEVLTHILSAFKSAIQSYCVTSHSRDGVNQMWILKNYNDLLELMQPKSLSSCNIIKTLFDFRTL